MNFDVALPLVSVITPVRNGSQFLEQLIQSVKQQTYPNIEHIIIDDGSDDDGLTLALLQKHTEIRFWSRTNKGQYATMNEGLRHARGKVVTFISADDLYADNYAIESMIGLWKQKPHHDAICGTISYINAKGERTGQRLWGSFWPSWMILYLNFLPHCSMFCDKDGLLAKELYFDESLRYCGDTDWVIQMYSKKFRVARTSRIVCKYRVHENQRTNDDGGLKSRGELRIIHERYRINLKLYGLARLLDLANQRLSTSMYDLRTGEYRKGFRRLTLGRRGL